MKSNKASFSLTFYISKTKMKKNGEVPVYLKIYCNGEKTSFQIKRHIHPDLWDTNRYKMKGRTAEANVFNDYLSAIRLRAHNQYNQLLKEHDHVTPFQLRDAIMGKRSASTRQVIEIWDEHLSNLIKLIGKENTATTAQKYRTCRNHFQDFLVKKYKVKDVSVKQVNRRMIEAFNLYLKTEKDIGYNTAIKFLQNFKRIMLIALRNGWIIKDPFMGMSLTLKEVDKPYLTEEELERIIQLETPFDRITRVKDFFVFSCFTGLAYADVKKLTGKEIIKTDSGYWIKTRRQKTGGIANIPLLPVPLAIINKYNPVEEIFDNDPVLPILSNQKMNAYLKELADLARITKNLSHHTALTTTLFQTIGFQI